jgi:hypothetical protein
MMAVVEHVTVEIVNLASLYTDFWSNGLLGLINDQWHEY